MNPQHTTKAAAARITRLLEKRAALNNPAYLTSNSINRTNLRVPGLLDDLKMLVARGTDGIPEYDPGHIQRGERGSLLDRLARLHDNHTKRQLIRRERLGSDLNRRYSNFVRDADTRRKFMAATAVIKNQKVLEDAEDLRFLARLTTGGGVVGAGLSGAYETYKPIRARHSREKKASVRNRIGGLLRRYWGNLSGKTYNRVFDNALRRQKSFIDPVLKHVQDATRDGKLFRLPQAQVDKLSQTGMKNIPDGFKGTFGQAYAALRDNKTQLSDKVRRAHRVALSNERKVMQAQGMRDLTRIGTAAVPLVGGGMYLGRYKGDG